MENRTDNLLNLHRDITYQNTGLEICRLKAGSLAVARDSPQGTLKLFEVKEYHSC